MAVFPGNLGGAMGTSTATIPSGSSSLTNLRIQYPNLVVTINDTPLTATVLGASVTYGFDVGIATATVDFAFGPNVQNQPQIDPFNQLNSLTYFDTVKVYCGATANGPNIAALRFTGVYLRTEADLWPHVFHMVCKGNLYRATQYYQASPFVGQPGFILNSLAIAATPLMSMTDQVSGQDVTGYFDGGPENATDSRIVYAILSKVPGLDVSQDNIRGTVDLGAYGPNGAIINFSQFAAFWPPYRSAWDMVQLFDDVFIGYRTYEGVGGTIYRGQIFGYPQGTADTTFTEGLDIWEAHGTRTVEQLCNAAYVEGASDQFNAGGQFVWAYVQSNNPFQGDASTNPVVDQTRSPFIEASNAIDASAGDVRQPGLHADDVAQWRLSERNRELVNVQLTTYRDDVLYIGHSIAVNIPHAAVTEPVWIQRVEIRVENQPPLFQQTIYGLGGGLPGFQPGLDGSINAGNTNPPGN